MHPNLSPSLHTPECNAIVEKLQECYKQHPYKKFLGVCDGLSKDMSACLRKERENNRRANYEKSLEKRKTSSSTDYKDFRRNYTSSSQQN